MEAAECGAAALGIVLGYYGRIVPLEELRVACDVSRDGSKASSIVKAARSYGLLARGVRVEPGRTSALPTPLIAFWDSYHFVVVEGFAREKVYLNDPATGPRAVSGQEFARSFSAVALTFEPGPDFRRGGARPGTLPLLRGWLRGAEPALLLVVLVSAVLALLGLAAPVAGRIFVDRYLIGGAAGGALPLVLGLGVAGLLAALCAWLQQTRLARLQAGLVVTQGSALFRRLLRLPSAFFAQRQPGELSTRVTIAGTVARALTVSVATNLLGVGVIIACVLLMLSYDAGLTALLLLIALLNAVAVRHVARLRTDQNGRLLRDRGLLNGATGSGLRAVESIKASGTEDDFFARWAGYEARVKNAEQRLDVATVVVSAAPPLLLSLGTVAVLGLGGLAVMDGRFTIGALLAFLVLAGAFMAPIGGLVGLATQVQDLQAGLRRMDDVFRYPVDPLAGDPLADDPLADDPPADGPAGGSSGTMPATLVGCVEMRNVTFGYSRLAPPLIEDFSLRIEPGARIALVGDSGSGKSTVTRLVAGLYQPWSGTITFDGRRRDEIPRDLLANSLAVVPQDVALFEGTIRENITLWDTTIPEERVRAAAGDAAIHDDIMAMPGGYDASLAEDGRNVSGGQRQRLVIARALAGDPTILVLDEATAALDAATEQRVDDNLRRRGCACLIIAHRLSTIRDCDEIIVLDRGTVVQRGTNESLRGVPGRYAALMKAAGADDAAPASPVAEVIAGHDAAAPFLHYPPAWPDREDSAGRPLSLEGNRPLLLDDPARVYIVSTGAADVFALRLEHGRPASPRRHLLRVAPGGLVCGMDAPAGGAGPALLVAGAPGTTVRELPLTALRQAAAEGTRTGPIATLLDGWLTALSAAIVRAAPPPDAYRMEAGQRLTVRRGVVTPAPGVGVIWIKRMAGETAFAGYKDIPTVGGDRGVPLCGSSWLEVTETAALEARATVSLVAGDALWHDLAHFHRLALDLIAAHMCADERVERERLRKRTEARRAIARDTAATLAAVPTAEAPPIPPGSADVASAPAPGGMSAGRGATRRPRGDDWPTPADAGADATSALPVELGGQLAATASAGGPGAPGSALEQACRLVGGALGVDVGAAPHGADAPEQRRTVWDIAHAAGVRVRAVTLTGDWWRRDGGPFLGFRRDGEDSDDGDGGDGDGGADGDGGDVNPVALLPVSPRRYVVVDPMSGAKTAVTAEAAATLAAHAYMFYPPLPRHPLTLRDIWRFSLRTARRDVATILLTGIAAGLLALVTPVATAYIVDTVIPDADRTRLLLVCLALLAITLAMALFRVVQGLAVLRIEGKSMLQAEVADRLLDLPLSFFRRYTAGDLGARLLGIGAIQQALSGPVVTSIFAGFFALFNVGVLLYDSVPLALVAVALVLVAAAVTVRAGTRQVAYQRRLADVGGRLAATVLQILNGIETVKMAGAETRAFARWARGFVEQQRLTYRSGRVNGALVAFNAGFPLLGMAVIFVVVAALHGAGLSAGRFLSFIVAFTQLIGSGLQMSAALVQVLSIVPDYERLKPIFEARSEGGPGMSRPGRLRGDIAVDHVSFRYSPTGPLVLDDVSIEARPGEFIALVGPSGSGKSTLLRLLLGLDAAEAGTILLDGRDLATLDPRAVRRRMGAVLQTSAVTPGRLADYITGHSGLTVGDAWEAARLAALAEDIGRMPMGLSTIVNERGGVLSGGQAQRLMIARAVAAKPPILLFDEATSALDNATQERIGRNLEGLSATRVVVAHRLSTVVNADRIYVLQGGKVIQTGTYAELMAQDGLFAALARRQLA